MPRQSPADSVEWMRLRWQEHELPGPSQFAAMASILRTTALMTDQIDLELKKHDLTRTGYLVLITLQMSRDSSRPLGQLGKVLLVHPTTVTMVVDQLEKAKLVRRVPHPSDRRTVLAKLTRKGRQAAATASAALAGIGFGLKDTSDATADRITADLRKARLALGDQD